jgi:hypothetical protein
MPALIGGFGKIKGLNYNFKDSSFQPNEVFQFSTSLDSENAMSSPKPEVSKKSSSSLARGGAKGPPLQLPPLRGGAAPYLAGLVEADGSIAVHDSKSKSQLYRPKIIIVFSLVDKPLADRLALITQVGKVYLKSDAGYVL